MQSIASDLNNIGIVTIGRNEGVRLEHCLLSIGASDILTVYVDSGSSDDSVSLARSLDAHVVPLDTTIPFTAGRARNKGIEELLKLNPNLDFVQFIDGDCTLNKNWLPVAYSTIVQRPDIAIVCGRRRERFPDKSIYNQICDLEWGTTVGETDTCGGDFLVRVDAFKQVDGFNPTFIAGEEPELCIRLRQQSWKILRIDQDMTLHDANITKFSQWWKRSIRAGHAYATTALVHGKKSKRQGINSVISICFWGIFLPIIATLLAGVTSSVSLLILLVIYIIQFVRIRKYRFKLGDTKEVSTRYGFLIIVGKFAQAIGVIQAIYRYLFRRRAKLVEYK